MHAHRRLKTMIVWLVNPRTGVREGLRVLLDSGSSHSFIAMGWITKLELRQCGTCNVNIKAFGQDNNRQVATVVEAKACNNLTTTDFTNITLLGLENFNLDVACYDLTYKQRCRMENCDFHLADPDADNKGRLPVDIYILNIKMCTLLDLL